MNGGEHYQEAERLLNNLDDTEHGSAVDISTIAEAQVHATLAQAAYTEKLVIITALASSQ